ncbi:MAG: hypothetical protein M9918_24845 [Anaerolineae bacterium]|nr:hypothetical protein [Anaerolineae bacterium]MCO5191405.1 hypothetical protein [Anaerolineae bacterium]
MMQIDFFDDPSRTPRSREDVRINDIGIYVHPGGRRIAVGFDLTPFIERPSLDVDIRNARGEWAGQLSVVQTPESNFHLNTFLRDSDGTDTYELLVVVYYAVLEDGFPRMEVDRRVVTFDVLEPGEKQVTLQ